MITFYIGSFGACTSVGWLPSSKPREEIRLGGLFPGNRSKNSKQRKERKLLSRRKNPVVLKAEFGSPREGRRKSRSADRTRKIEKLVIVTSQDGMDPPMLI